MHQGDRGHLAEPMAQVEERRQSGAPGDPVATTALLLVLASLAHQTIDPIEHRSPPGRRAIWARRHTLLGEPQDLGPGWHALAQAGGVLLVRLGEVEPQHDIGGHGCSAVR